MPFASEAVVDFDLGVWKSMPGEGLELGGAPNDLDLGHREHCRDDTDNRADSLVGTHPYQPVDRAP